AQGSINANQVINTLPHADEAADDHVHFLGAIGRAWATGLAVPMERQWAGIETRRIPLPTYAFQHEPYWIAPNETPRSVGGGSFKHPTADDWFAAPTWVRSPLLSRPDASADGSEVAERRWLVFSDGSSLAARLAKRLEGRVVLVTNGAEFKKVD